MQEITQGVYFQQTPSTKYKTNYLMIKFVAPYTVERASAWTLLSYFMENGSQKIPDKRSIEAQLAELYGADLSVSTKRQGSYLEYTLTSQTVRASFLEEDPDAYLNRWLALLSELLFNQDLSSRSTLYQERLQREKINLITRMKRQLDDKGNLAMRRLLEKIYQGDACQYLGASGDEAVVEALTLEDLQQAYEDLLTQSAVYIVGHGEMDGPTLSHYFQEQGLIARSTATIDYSQDRVEIPEGRYQLTTEATDGVQGNLVLAYHVHTSTDMLTRVAAQMANSMFGGLPTSSLFMHVREAHSLAYSIRSSLIPSRQLIIVAAGIDPVKVDQVCDQVNQELSNLRTQKIDNRRLQEVKTTLISQDIQSRDSQNHEVILAFLQKVQPTMDYSQAAYQATVEAVTAEDIQEVLHTVTPLQGFLLAGKGQSHGKTRL